MERKLATRHDGGLKDKALAAARALVQRHLQPGMFIDGTVHAAPLAPESARPLMLAMLRRHASVSAWNLSQVSHWAREGVDEADQVLSEMAAEYLNSGEPVPAILVGHVVEQFHPRTGPRRAKNFAQDICIALLVLWLSELFRLRPTRSGRSSAKPSACSIMATALADAGIYRGGEGAVQKIWMNYRDLAFNERQTMRDVITTATAVVTVEAQLGLTAA